jgi:hypothetical protein
VILKKRRKATGCYPGLYGSPHIDWNTGKLNPKPKLKLLLSIPEDFQKGRLIARPRKSDRKWKGVGKKNILPRRFDDSWKSDKDT